MRGVPPPSLAAGAGQYNDRPEKAFGSIAHSVADDARRIFWPDFEPISAVVTTYTDVARVTKRRIRRARVVVSSLGQLKGALTVAGDIRSNVGFQNDVNALLASVSQMAPLGPVIGLDETPRLASRRQDAAAANAPAPGTAARPRARLHTAARGRGTGG
jgi:hypothetical protein